jgi:multidrug resistance efflux pump
VIAFWENNVFMTKRSAAIPFRIRIVFWMRRWVYLFWLLLFPVAWLLQPDSQVENSLLGLVSAESETVGPIETVRIRKINVSVGQKVEVGDTLVEVEGFAEAQEMNDQLTYRLRSLEFKLNMDRDAQEKQVIAFRLHSALDDSRVSLEETRLNQQRDQATHDSLKTEVDGLRPLVEKRLVSELELIRIRPQLKALEQTLACYPTFLKAQQERYDLALKAWEGWQAQENPASSNTQWSAEQRQTLQGLAKHVTSSDTGQIAYLKSKSKGIVSRIQYKPGDVVSAGVPVLRIMRPDQTEITGLLRPHQAALIHEGLRLTVIAPFREIPRRYHARVVRLEPELLDLMDPFSTPSSVRFPTRGRRFYLAIEDATHDLIPGESVLLNFPALTFTERCRHAYRQFEARINRIKQ